MQDWYGSVITGVAALAIVSGLSVTSVPFAYAVDSATTAPASCNDSMLPERQIMGRTVGETDCTIVGQSTVNDSRGRPFVRLDIAIGGVAIGYVDPVTKGNTRQDMTEVPNILYPQFGIPDWVPAFAKYSGENGKGAGLTLLYPDPASHTPWNGKVFLIVHGQNNNTPLGDMVPRHVADKFTNATFTNFYAGLMIDKGYAVIYTRRPAEDGVMAALADGTELDESLNDNVGLILDFLGTGKNLLKSKLGKDATATYFYGHSSGVILGRLINYTDLNYSAEGHRYLDGFLFDDAGGGLPLPLSLKQGKVLGQKGNMATFEPGDKLFASPESKERFTKEINLSHARYISAHDWLPDVSYLNLKRQNALLLHQQGMDDQSRAYEIDGVNHIANTTKSPKNTLDIGGVIDASIDLLDKWVQGDVAPPPSMINLAALGTDDAFAATKTRTVQLPPLACPTGFRYPWGPLPAGGSTQTGYAAYDGTSPEPIDSRGFLIDINGNGYRDTMPTMEEEWKREGLLDQSANLDKAAYVKCVGSNTDALVKLGLLSPAVASWYVDQANAFPAVPW